MERSGDWIQTHTIRQYWPLDPRAEDVSIRDIGHALANTCRFTGHVHSFYSVAEHSVRVSMYLEQNTAGVIPDEERLLLARWGLLHDASEAYLLDVARPVKRSPEMGAYREAEKRNMEAICRHFGLPSAEPAAVKTADTRLCYTEARDLFPRVHPAWRWDAAPLHERLRPRFLSVFGPLLTGLLTASTWARQRKASAAILRARLRCGTMGPTGARAAFRARFEDLFPGRSWE